MKTIEDLMIKLDNVNAKTTWNKAVKDYAKMIIDNLISTSVITEATTIDKLVIKLMLNGVSDWNEYSTSGMALNSDREIASRLCTETELKRKRNGDLPPSQSETWVQAQARCLYQASNMISTLVHEMRNPLVLKDGKRVIGRFNSAYALADSEIFAKAVMTKYQSDLILLKAQAFIRQNAFTFAIRGMKARVSGLTVECEP